MTDVGFHLSTKVNTVVKRVMPVAEAAEKVASELNSLVDIARRLAGKLPEGKNIEVQAGSNFLGGMSDCVQTVVAVAAPRSTLREGLRN